MSMTYAGIGSRKTPGTILDMMQTIAARLGREGWTLRSGHADGADQAFEQGGRRDADVFLPWPSFNRAERIEGVRYYDRPRREAYDIAEKFHPAWDNLKEPVCSLHARNVHQILGLDLASPSKFVICWTPNGDGSGGTGQALRVAKAYSVPVFDLGSDSGYERVMGWLFG